MNIIPNPLDQDGDKVSVINELSMVCSSFNSLTFVV